MKIMKTNKPYLIRAFYDWIVDNACTPLLNVFTNVPHCQVPQEFIENDQIILNIAPKAIRDLKISNHTIDFRASFSGVVHIISVPVKAVLSIYAEENNEGMFFEYDADEDGGWEIDPVKLDQPDATVAANSLNSIKVSHLKLVE